MHDRPRILVFGAGGQVGWELCRTLAVMGEVVPVTRAGPLAFDLNNLAELQAFLATQAPDVIVNAAAYTAVDRAENERELAFLLNAAVPEVLGTWAARQGVPVVHYSTDYVYDGDKAQAYTEDDPTCPVSVYGESKLAGDDALLASGAAAWILRVSWVYGLRGHNFLRTMRRLLSERDSLDVVSDQIGAPTWSRMIAEATAVLVGRVLPHDDAARATHGVYHLSPAGATSWCGFATAVRDLLDLECEVRPIPTSDYPTAAKRPHNSRLDSTRLQQTFGVGLPDWESSLRQCIADIQAIRA